MEIRDIVGRLPGFLPLGDVLTMRLVCKLWAEVVERPTFTFNGKILRRHDKKIYLGKVEVPGDRVCACCDNKLYDERGRPFRIISKNFYKKIFQLVGFGVKVLPLVMCHYGGNARQWTDDNLYHGGVKIPFSRKWKMGDLQSNILVELLHEWAICDIKYLELFTQCCVRFYIHASINFCEK